MVCGVGIAFGTFCVFVALNFLRVNLFLEQLTGRPDWQNMMVRFRASGPRACDGSSTSTTSRARHSRLDLPRHSEELWGTRWGYRSFDTRSGSAVEFQA